MIKKIRNQIKSYSLRTQIIFGMTILAVLSTSAVGLIALRINYRYLEDEKRNQSLVMIQEYYQAQEQELSNLIQLTASRPSLALYIQDNNSDALENYLNDYADGIPQIDSISVCSMGDDVLTKSFYNPLGNSCKLNNNPSYKIVYGEDGLEAWLLRGRQILYENEPVGVVILGIHLDNTFLMEMCDHCNLYHSILYEGHLVASSFGNRYKNKTTVVGLNLSKADESFQEQFTLDGHQFYVSRFPLSGKGLEVEVALDITSLQRDHRQQELFLIMIILGVALVSILLGAILAQYIQRPLAQLVKSAKAMQTLNLAKPVVVNSNIDEVIELTQVLENSRKRIQESISSLKKETEWNSLLLESIVEGIIILENEKIIYFSPGAERITGWSQTETLNKSIDLFIQSASQTGTINSILPPIGEKIRGSFILKNAEKKILAITHAELNAEKGEVPNTVLVLRDVNKEEAHSHLLGSFLGNITHEFRTPLSAQAASIEIILNEGESLSTEERADLLNSIYISTLNLEKLIDNLLEGSSIETGRFAINTQPTDIKKVVFSACESFEPMLKKYGQSFVFNLPNTLPIVLIDDRRINQVLLNLISNACKYGPSNEEIEISATIIGDFVEVSVSDKGEGVSDEEKKTIFSGMAINDSDNGRKQKGFRLGLSVSSTIITTHGGKIGIRDSKYGGSEFYFTVPISGDV